MIIELQEISKVIMGQSPKGESYNDEKIGLPLLNGAADYKGKVFKPKKYTSEPTRIAYKGDILLGVRATIGNFTFSDNDYCIGRGVAAIRVDESKADKGYILKCVEKELSEIIHKLSGSTIKGIRKEDLTEMKLNLPPLPTQQKIASILDAADTLRQKDKALLAKYDELTQSLFLDMFGDIINNQKKWQYINFGTIFKSIRYGASTPPVYINEGIPFIRATNVKNGTVVKKGMVFISIEEASKIEKCKLKEGDLIVVRSGANTGDCCRIPSNYKDGYGGFDLIIEIEEPYSTFYNFLLNTKAGKKTLEPLTRRAGQPHLNSKQLTELQVFKTPLNLQTQFAECVAIIEQQKAIAQASLEKSEELFNSLLQKAFKGELA